MTGSEHLALGGRPAGQKRCSGSQGPCNAGRSDVDPAPGWRAGGAPFQPPWRPTPGRPSEGKVQLECGRLGESRQEPCGVGARNSRKWWGDPWRDLVPQAEPRGGAWALRAGDGRSRQRGAGSQLDCGRQSPGARLSGRARGGRGRERRFPDQVWEVRIAWNGRPLLVRVRSVSLLSPAPFETFWKSYLSFSCALKSRPPARLPTSRCLLVAASSPKAWAPSAPGAGHLFGSAWVPAPELWGSWGSICGVKCWTSRVPFIV